jgi:hypothetical protein
VRNGVQLFSNSIFSSGVLLSCLSQGRESINNGLDKIAGKTMSLANSVKRMVGVLTKQKKTSIIPRV